MKLLKTFTKDFAKEPGCEPLVREAFAAMDDLFQKKDYRTLSTKFKLCQPISDPAGYHHLLLWLRNAFTIMAMVDYPYPASFLGTLPGWPVHAACQTLVNETQSGVDILTAIKDLAGILYNDTTDCFDIYAQVILLTKVLNCLLFLKFINLSSLNVLIQQAVVLVMMLLLGTIKLAQVFHI